ncbi:hypothetical protein [Clostridioides difficile]|uniref:hypothetical protein n=1 Tax=Clostridioides difficile TaxID=1496 RepID=UPI002FCFEE25|nr:hypothetical protein [Clostridioides difficile]
MIKYTYKDITIKNNLRIIFLCGVKFRRDDKRVVLKKYLEQNLFNKALILEEFFELSRRGEMLVYSNINLNSLFEVEILTAFLADVIFIIHESHSTAAELGVFASNKNLYKKICILSANELNIEENKLSGFIELAFSRSNLNIPNIEFYPNVDVNVISDNISNYHTFFPNKSIGYNLGRKITKFVEDNVQKEIELSYEKSRYGSSLIEKNSYYIDKSKKEIYYYVDYKLLKHYIIALFSIDEFKSEIRRSSDMKQSIYITERWYKQLVKDTICEKEGIKLDKYEDKFRIKGYSIENIKIEVGVAYILYVLHSIKLIKLPTGSRNFVIKHDLVRLCETTFGSIINKEKYRVLGVYNEK